MKDKSTILPANQKPRIKFVKKAGLWCRTTWVDDKQKQEWFKEKPIEKKPESKIEHHDEF
ncbi:MAG: hypothetical protein KJI72_00155 [Patescibacteria group bacterium]|nr:hypothetical protein [Patescibacteria group bacterium]